MTRAREYLEVARAAGAYDGSVEAADRLVGARAPAGLFWPKVRRHGARVALHAPGRAPSVHDVACLEEGTYRASSRTAHASASRRLEELANTPAALGRWTDRREAIGGPWVGGDRSRRRAPRARYAAGRAQSIHLRRLEAWRYLCSLSSEAVRRLAREGAPHAERLAGVRLEWAELLERAPREVAGLVWLVQTSAGRRLLGLLYLLEAHAEAVPVLPVRLLGSSELEGALAEVTGWTYGRLAYHLGRCPESGLELRPATLGHTSSGHRLALERAGLVASTQPPSELASATEIGRGPAALRYALPRAAWEGAGAWGRLEHHQADALELLEAARELLEGLGRRAPRAGHADHVEARMRRASLEAQRAHVERKRRGERKLREARAELEARRLEELEELERTRPAFEAGLEELARRLEALERPPPR